MNAQRVRSRRFFSIGAFLIAPFLGFGLIDGASAQDREARDQLGIDSFRLHAEIGLDVSDADLKAQLKEWLDLLERDFQEMKRAETATANGAGSVSAATRCAEGYLTSTHIEASAADVEIARERQADCDEVGCRAVQIDAYRQNAEPFTVTVAVSCSG